MKHFFFLFLLFLPGCKSSDSDVSTVRILLQKDFYGNDVILEKVAELESESGGIFQFEVTYAKQEKVSEILQSKDMDVVCADLFFYEELCSRNGGEASVAEEPFSGVLPAVVVYNESACLFYHTERLSEKLADFPDESWDLNTLEWSLQLIASDRDDDGTNDKAEMLMTADLDSLYSFFAANQADLDDLSDRGNCFKISDITGIFGRLCYEENAVLFSESRKDAVELFLSGEYALFLSTTSVSNELSEADFEWRTAVLPYKVRRAELQKPVALVLISTNETLKSLWAEIESENTFEDDAVFYSDSRVIMENYEALNVILKENLLSGFAQSNLGFCFSEAVR